MWTVVRVGLAVAGLLAMQAPGAAQQNPGNNPAKNPAMENPSVVQPKAGVSANTPLTPGANSFAEGQARDLLKSRGYSDISPLVNDSQGIWRGTAMNGSTKVQVSVDYKGNVAAQPQ